MEVKLGSHNSFTYLPVKQWYFKPFFWTARCQKKNIKEQYKLGARLFDIRIRTNSAYDIIMAHGPVEFEGDIYELLDDMENLGEKVYCRVILESNKPMKNQEYQEERFKDVCYSIEQDYKNIIFFGGNRKYDWKEVYHFEATEPSLDGKYSSVIGTKIDDLWPWLYAKTHNKKNIKNGTDKDFLFIDFVNIQ